MIDKLQKYYEDGWLLKQTHPTLDLTIWNYSPKVQYDRYWDDVTLQCRGLVTNSEGAIIARPFKKFFNYEELPIEHIPNESFEVYDKMDGSLGILFYYNNEWHLATRGSFTSDQAIRGKEILKNYDTTELLTDYTYLFEIIYPENRIVIEYDKEMLMLLGAIKTETGEEMDYASLGWHSIMQGYPLVKKYNGVNDYKTLKAIVSNDQEGFVIRFKNGFRMKIKGEEYCRLHRILTNVSTRNIWEYLRENKPFDDLLEKVPDEFYNWVKHTVKNFESKHEEILGHVITDFWEIDAILNKEQLEMGNDLVYTEKEYAKRYAEEAFKKKYPHLLFSYRKEILNPGRTSKAIWDMLYPEYQKPFKKDDEE
jgi:RNA ligase